MNLKKPLIIAFLVIFYSFLPGQNLSLKDLQNLLIKNNLDIKISDLREKIAKQNLRISNAWDNPEIEYGRGKAEPFETQTKKNIWGIGINLKIPNPIYKHFLIKTNKKEYSKALLHEEIFKRTLKKELKISYYLYQFYLKVYSILEENEKITKELVGIIKLKKETGEAREIDYSRAELERIKVTAEIFKFKQLIKSERIQINHLLNNSLTENSKIKSDFNFHPSTFNQAQIKNYVNNTLIIKQSVNELNGHEYNFKAQKNSFIESFSLFAKTGNEPDAKVFSIGIGLEIPIFNTKAANVKRAKLYREKALKELENEKNHLYSKLQNKISNLKFQEMRINNFKNSILIERDETLKLTTELFKEGEMPLTDFINTQRSIFETQIEFFKTITEWFILKSDIEEILGEKI